MMGYCDDLFSLHGINVPSRRSFISQLNNHHREDSTKYINSTFETLNFYYQRIVTVGCPVSQTGSMYDASAMLVDALEAITLRSKRRMPGEVHASTARG